MKIEDFKKLIESNSVPNDFVVFKYSDNDFVALQYAKAISKQKNLSINYIEPNNNVSIFSNNDFNLDVCRIETLDMKISKNNNTIVICKKISKELSTYYDNIIDIPKLERWQIKDYALSKLSKVNEKYVSWLLDICNYNIYRLDLEIQKLNVVNATDVEFKIFAENGTFNDLTNNTVFNLTNALIKRDKSSFINAYADIDCFDISPMGFWTILCRSFKNVIDIQLSVVPTPQSCGLKENQFWAIKKNNIGIYTKEELVNIYRLLLDIDFKIKTGQLLVENLIDYLIIKIH